MASAVAFLLLLGLVAAILSVFITSDVKITVKQESPAPPGVPYGIVIAGSLFLSSLVLLTVVVTPVNSDAFRGWRIAALVVGLLAIAAGGIMLHQWKRIAWAKIPRPSLQLAVLIVAVFLTATATYGAMRIETRSQLTHSVEVGSVIKSDGTNLSISLTIHASKLPSADYVGYTVLGLPSSVALKGECTTANTRMDKAWSNQSHYQKMHRLAVTPFPVNEAPCSADPCDFYQYDPALACATISGGTISPNATGGVDEQLEVPLKEDQYQIVDVRSRYCLPTGCLSTNSGGTRQDFIMPS